MKTLPDGTPSSIPETAIPLESDFRFDSWEAFDEWVNDRAREYGYTTFRAKAPRYLPIRELSQGFGEALSSSATNPDVAGTGAGALLASGTQACSSSPTRRRILKATVAVLGVLAFMPAARSARATLISCHLCSTPCWFHSVYGY
jgi:hypothetical protein